MGINVKEFLMTSMFVDEDTSETYFFSKDDGKNKGLKLS